MFTEFPKLFDRNFAVGFLLPAFFLSFGTWLILGAYEIVHMAESVEEMSRLSGAVIAVFLVWFTAICLLSLNRPITRLFEGYPALYLLQRMGGGRHAFYTPLFRRLRRSFPQQRGKILRFQRKIDATCTSLQAHLTRRSRLSFRRWALPALKLQRTVDAARAIGNPDPWMPATHPRRLARAVEEFPHDQQWVLPTRFGNLIRAFEVYPSVLYGLDAIPAWPRLQAVMPEQIRRMLAETKAQVDFSLNLATPGIVTVLLYLALASWYWEMPLPWLLLGGISFALFGYHLALSAAAQFGSYVKSAFDLYRSELAKALGLTSPESLEVEREMWGAVSRMMIYRSRARADELSRFRPCEDDVKNLSRKERGGGGPWAG